MRCATSRRMCRRSLASTPRSMPRSIPPPRATRSRQHGSKSGSLRRYGFHGLSCEWSASRAAALLERPVDSLRLVICHLGGGASVTATAGGRSVDTTMGFTPTEGLVMATRPGDVDPGAIAWVAAHGVAPGRACRCPRAAKRSPCSLGWSHRRHAGAAGTPGQSGSGGHPGGGCLPSSSSGEDRSNDRRHGRDGRRGVYGGRWRERERNTGHCVRAPRVDRCLPRRRGESVGRFSTTSTSAKMVRKYGRLSSMRVRTLSSQHSCRAALSSKR